MNYAAMTPETLRTFATLELAFAGLFGAVIGSFLTACIHRLPRDISLLKRSRSFCPKCDAQIAWYDNVPVLSWLILRGRCRKCSEPISPRYIAVELITALGFVIVFYHCRILNGPFGENAADGLPVWGLPHAVVIAALFAALVAITFIDIDHRIIPDVITIPGIALGPVLSTAFPTLHAFRFGWIENAHLDALVASLFGLVIGGGHIWLLGLAGKLAFKKDAMGFGDVKMMAMVGGLLGWPVAVFATPVAALIGSVIGIILLIKTKDHYVPFGPFLAAGTLVMIFYGAFAVAYFQRPFAGGAVAYAFRMPLVSSLFFN